MRHGSRICLLAVAPVLFLTSAGAADMTIHAILITYSGPIEDTLTATTYVKGPWIRRSLEGEGMLAELLGVHVEVLDRSTGERTLIYPRDKAYTRSKDEHPFNHPISVVDLRWLGRVRAGVRGEVRTPEQSKSILGCPSVPVDIRLPSRHSGSSTIRFWICADLPGTLSDGTPAELWSGAEDRSAQTAAVAAEMARRFGLSEADQTLLARFLGGIPMMIESFTGEAGTRQEVSRWIIQRLDTIDVTDSLFAVPSDYKPAGPARD